LPGVHLLMLVFIVIFRVSRQFIAVNPTNWAYSQWLH
jgi:hypothetical protein